MRQTLFSVGVLLSILAMVVQAHAGSSTIIVDLDKGTVDPTTPTVNNWSEDTILIQLVNGKDLTTYGELDVPVAPGVAVARSQADPLPGRFFAVTFRRCSRSESDSPCPHAELNQQTASWTVYTHARNFVFQITKVTDNPAYDPSQPPSPSNSREILTQVRSFTISVEQKPFALGWSAGFTGFPGVEDRRYRVSQVADTESMAPLQRVSDHHSPYQLAAFAHYAPIRHRGIWAFSVGLATDAPVEDLTIMLGASLAARTLPVVNTGYLTAGIAYTKRDRLRPEYEGMGMVAASLSPDALVDGEYGLGAFVAVSFEFFGGEDKFKGVYSGGSAK